MNTDHIVHNAVTQRMECKHCGFYGAVKMPDTIDSILAQFDVFIEAHKGCQPPAHKTSPVYKPPSEAVMSEYIAGFDAGCDFILREIEAYERGGPSYAKTIPALLAHLCMESKNGPADS
jgi:hypothetical protein